VTSETERPPHAPDGFECLLLHAALGEADECRAAWDEAADVAGHVSTLDYAAYRLLPLLYRNLQAQGVEDPRMGILAGVYRHSWCSNQQRFHVAAELIDRLNAKGIETIVLKGAALSALHYRDFGVRPVWDVDVLVRSDSVAGAAEVLSDAGWAPPPGERRSLEYMMRFRHAKLYECPTDGGIDLHWYPLSEPVPAGDVWEHTVPMTISGVETRALGASDELLMACVHGLGRYGARVRWISDAATVARGGEVDWDRLVARAQRWHVSARLELGLRVIRDEFGVAVPDTVLRQLSRVRRPYHERVAHQALVRRPRRGVATIVEWDRYRRLRALGADAAAGGFGRYMRELIEAPNWPSFVAGYRRRDSAAIAESTSAHT
jgi:hypothetical protein